MHQLGCSLAKLLDAGDLVLLTGPLGAGKTTLSRGIGEGLGVIGTVSSPTFVIARTHKREGSSTPLVHVDAYRLSSPAEFDDLDIDLAHSIVLVEWGRGFTDELTNSWLDIEIERDQTGASEVRELTITGFGPRFTTEAVIARFAALGEVAA
ncbi:MAG: tRNA (adenosine(37)-N6)-threonylcarbamoyltransferase complex ATPase subunit type 1 TsaE [Microbacteriaceae bacterium]|nr:tRNA (adenosine(37)-N6)-threonylcarbamoyltransferase complex ATPase subunit type 1 TsaE [Microbacteriaceae bacterium]